MKVLLPLMFLFAMTQAANSQVLLQTARTFDCPSE